MFTFTVFSRNGLIWAGTDEAAAKAYAQSVAQEESVQRPNYATPHLLIHVWSEGQQVSTIHIYAKGHGK